MCIIETCPKCGHDLIPLVLASYPPIPAKSCLYCNYYWEGEREQIQRIPFVPMGITLSSAQVTVES